jgi:hypothetical protein
MKVASAISTWWSFYATLQAADHYCAAGLFVHLADGEELPCTGNNPLDTSIAISPSFVTGWVNSLVRRSASAPRARYGTPPMWMKAGSPKLGRMAASCG